VGEVRHTTDRAAFEAGLGPALLALTQALDIGLGRPA